MTAIFHREPHETLPVAVRGEGAYLYDASGRQYLDASGGAAVSCLGHGHPRIIAAIREQAAALAYAHTSFFTSEPAERLAALLIEQAPAGLSNVYFLSGGSEATEAALKLARQYHLVRGESTRSIFISRRQSYHGNTLGALSVSGNHRRRARYEPILIPTRRIAPCYAYRHRKAGESDLEYGRRAADELEAEILEVGAERVAAFIAEPVVGATLGAVPAVSGYFARIAEICRKYGVLLILDEVMCGMGRTGTPYAASGEGVVPDMVTLAKGLAAGYQPIGALIVQKKIYDAISAGRGSFEHGHTYSGHPIACAAALAVQQTLRDGLWDQVQPLGRMLEARLREALGSHEQVGDIRGRGLLLGVEIVADRATQRPFEPGRGVARRVKSAAMQRGLICYPGSGTADGVAGDHVLIAPPYIVTHAQIDELVAKLAASLDDALRA